MFMVLFDNIPMKVEIFRDVDLASIEDKAVL
jgi:hypothetical protein